MAFIDKIRERVTIIPDIPGHNVQADRGGKDVNKLMELAYQELYWVIQWAKDVPGFKEIELEDQVCLLKACFMDLNVFRLAYRSVACDPMSLRFGKDLILEKHEVVSFGWTEDLVETTLEFTDKLRSLNLDPNEFACLSALVLLCPGLWIVLISMSFIKAFCSSPFLRRTPYSILKRFYNAIMAEGFHIASVN